MKKIFALLLAVIMVLSMAACGAAETPATEAAPAATQSNEATEAATTEAAPTYNFKVSITQSTNIVTAAEAPLATLYASSLQEVAKYCTLSNHLVSTGMMVLPEDIFNSMPEEYQQILTEAVYQAGSDFTAYNLNSEAEYQAKMEEAGVTFITPDVASFAAKASAMYSSGDLSFTPGLYEEIQAIISG